MEKTAVNSRSSILNAQRISGSKKAGKMRMIPLLEQWVEIWSDNGVTRTELYPPNDQLLKEAEKMDPSPELVYRRLNFRNGVPAEYLWTLPNKQTLRYGGGGIQRMTVEQWLHVIERETESACEHIGPTGVGNLPRPNERGGCECAVCTMNQPLLEELGFLI